MSTFRLIPDKFPEYTSDMPTARCANAPPQVANTFSSMPPRGNPFPRSVILSVIGDLLSLFACSLSHFSNSRIHFGIFPNLYGNLLSPFASWLSHFSNSRIHFGIFPKLYGNLLFHFARWLSHFSNSRILGHIPDNQLSHRQSQNLSLRKPQRSSSKVEQEGKLPSHQGFTICDRPV